MDLTGQPGSSRFRHCSHLHLQTLPLLLRISRVLWYIFSLFRKARTWFDAENAPWIPQAPLNLHHKSVLSSKKLMDFDDGRLENAQKLNLLFVKNDLFQRSIWGHSKEVVLSSWVSFNRRGGKIPQEIWCQKSDPLWARGCRVLVESGRLWHPGLEAISKPSCWEDLEGEKRIFLGYLES